MITEKPTIVNKKQLLINWILVTLQESAWAPFLVICFYLIELELHLFRRFPSLDNPSHVLGGIAITYFYRSAVSNSQKLLGDIPLSIQIFLAFTCAVTTTVLWEFYENAFDLFFRTHMVRGLRDTLGDMFFGLLGAFVLSLFYKRYKGID